MTRQLDLIIADLLGLEVLGEAPCYPDYGSSIGWSVSYDGKGTMQFVYLNRCCCDDPLDSEIKYLGHVASCLGVVPMYHKHDTLARRALEQICDRHGLDLRIRRPPDTKAYEVILHDAPFRRVAYSVDKKFPLAICKALVELEKNNE